MLIPVVISGGAGTRLWPLSRESYPKQFWKLTGGGTMLQNTLARLDGLDGVGQPLVVCSEGHRFIVAEQLRQAGVEPGAVVLEPVGRNTAPAVAAAALAALEAWGDDAVLLVLPADHVLHDDAAFREAVRAGLPAARAGKLVTFGVVPTRPETGYGYIRRGDGAGPDYPVAQFVEKPPFTTAQEYVASGRHYWNSGMFLFRADAFLAELRELAPAMYAACSAAVAGAKRERDFLRLPPDEFAACPSDSVDYAVMERTRRAVVVPLDAGWSDVGSWAALHDALPADAVGNVAVGDVIARDSSGCYLHSSGRLVAAVGLEDHVVVETADVVMVAPKGRAQELKGLVGELARRGRSEASSHREVQRPWGHYASVDAGDRFQVKRLVVKPGATLSLQMHHHRAEHWVVVAGTARVVCDDRVFLLQEGQSTFIPAGAKHRVENPGKVVLQMVEVQCGPYLGEDDIVRFEDAYGRAGEEAAK